MTDGESNPARPVVERALELPVDERSAFLDAACGGDAALRSEAERLLASEVARACVPTEIAPFRRDASSGTDAARLADGTIVNGRYRIERMLASGGMGEVYRALDLQLERPVALKLIRSHLLSSPTIAERFRREAVAVARLRHPSIVTVHDYGVSEEAGAYIVMELLEGRSLRHELATRGRLEPRAAAAAIYVACRAVEAAHREGIIHRDLKPENIFLETRGGVTTVKVVDFGLAKLEAALVDESSAPVTNDDVVFGTPLYMSPEQCVGNDADARSDVYSLGCVLFESLTGRTPFSGKPVMSILYKHVNEPPPVPSTLVASIPPELDAAVLRALAKTPTDRFASMSAFAAALESTTGGAGVDTMEDGTPTGHAGVDTEEGGDARTSRRPPANLPQGVSTFIGREEQIDDVERRIAASRLVTLVGPGGIGKTRLSLEVAARTIYDFDDGAWFVELAPVADPSLVVDAISDAIGMRDRGPRTTLEAVVAALRERRALVVLDNCEHVVEAAAHVVDALLRSCPRLRVLATSREALGVAGESVWLVPALTLPDPAEPPTDDALSRSEATRLFVDRAGLVRSDARASLDAVAVTDVCRRLDGIPLAIELAAACTRVLSVPQIAERLADRYRLLKGGNRTAPARHQTLRAAIDWSHDMLSEEERVLLHRASVFAGGWSLEAIEAIASGGENGLEEIDVLGSLSRLVAASLVIADVRDDGTTRYRMYESILEYAAEKLRERGATRAMRARHLQWFLGLAETAEPQLIGPDQRAWVERLAEEHDNLRAALRTSLDELGDVDAALRLCYALGRFWSVRAHLTEGFAWIDRVLAANPDPASPLLPRVLVYSSQLARLHNDMDAARERASACLALAERNGDLLDVGGALNELFNIEAAAYELDRALAYGERSLAVFEAIGDLRGQGLAHTSIGTIACERSDFEAGREALRARARRPSASGRPTQHLDDLQQLGTPECAAG
jgi:non-specific serine/threonine protein kinase